MDLPTYTNIWRIEKRLYKLYDFRLPAPLPINWIAVFTGITVPYVVLLIAVGLPFNHTLVWLYVLPPGVLTWLTTRPVIESKRLPELLESQIRYLTEPRVWCRLAPLSEKDQIIVTARVWHSRRAPRQRDERGAVALRERGVLARRNGQAAPAVTAVPFDDAASVAASAATAAPAAAAAAGASSARGSARLRARARGKGPAASRTPVRARSASARLAPTAGGAGPQPAPGSWPVTEPVTEEQRPPAGPWPGAEPQLGAGQWPVAEPVPAVQPWTAPGAQQVTELSALGSLPAATQHPARDRAVGKPGRFRLSALRSKPTRPAPALPPAVTLKPPATPDRAGPAGPPTDDSGGAQLTTSGSAQPVGEDGGFGPAAAPWSSQMPVHATPDVHPVKSARERSGGTGAPRIEVSHSGPGHRAPSHWPEPPAAGPPPAAPPEPPQAQPPEQAPEQLQAQRQAQPLKLPHVTAVTQSEQRTPSIERALSGPSKDRNLSWHGKVRVVTSAMQGPGARDQEALDRARARLPLAEPKRVLMLGCTSGAGQTVTTLMTGHILASLREQPVAAVDLHDGTLAAYSEPVGWLEEIVGGKPPEKRAASRPDGLSPTPRDSAARLDVIASHETLKDGDERLLAEHLGRHYPLAMLDPGATGLTKLLTITDQLVVVVPASLEAAGALADTRDWLDAHGFADLAGHSVTLVNGVSRRSMSDVVQAESVARGRCRAIVRVPWDDMLQVGLAGPSTLGAQARVAYTALAGVLVAGMAAGPVRKNQ